MTEREKIINIIEQNKDCDVNTAANCRECKYNKELENYKDMGCGSLKAADALIAANIGDVTEWKERAEKAEKERDEYRKSTHIALRGIEILKRNILRYFATEFPNILQQAEREIEEEKND